MARASHGTAEALAAFRARTNEIRAVYAVHLKPTPSNNPWREAEQQVKELHRLGLHLHHVESRSRTGYPTPVDEGQFRRAWGMYRCLGIPDPMVRPLPFDVVVGGLTHREAEAIHTGVPWVANVVLRKMLP